MKTVLYYFSGTGNSLQVAQRLSQLLGETTIHAISSAATPDVSTDVVGFVFPVSLWGVPDIVMRFIEKIPRGLPDSYFYAIATYKSQPGDVIGQFQRKLSKRGARLSAGFMVPMPGNNIVFYQLESIQEQESKLTRCQNQLSEIAQSINSRQNILPVATFVERFLCTGLLHRALTSTFHNADKQFWTESACVGCGICSKVCPVSNIKLMDGHPQWQHNCQLCLACINLCPSKAIQYGTYTQSKNRYMNPTIDVTNLFR